MKNKQEWKDNLLGYLTYAYGIFSSYCLYRILFSEKSLLLFVLILLLGGFIIAIGAGIIFATLDGEDSFIPKYIKIVILSIYFIPIALFIAYVVKLSMIRDSAYALNNDDIIHFKYSVEYTVDDPSNQDSKWSVTLSDYNNREIEIDKAFEVNKNDMLMGLVNIECESHDIYDNEYPEANYSSSTVQRQFYIWVGDNYKTECGQSGGLIVYDENGNEITVELEVKAIPQYQTWDVLTARKVENNGLQIFDSIGKPCPNLVDYIEVNDQGSVISDSVFTFANEAGSRGVMYTGNLYGQDVAITMEPDSDAKYNLVSATTLGYMTESEAKTYMKTVQQGIIDKYAIEDVEEWIDDDTRWAQIVNNLRFIIDLEEYEDGYSVVTWAKKYQVSGQDLNEDSILEDENENNKDDPPRFYALNKESGIYHLPDCPSAQSIKQENKKVYETTRAELEASGFVPCSKCIDNENAAKSLEEVAEETGTQEFNYKKVKLKEIDSSAISELGYDENFSILVVRFKDSGDLYAYYDVSHDVYLELLSASSIGSYFYSNIRSEYTCVKLE